MYAIIYTYAALSQEAAGTVMAGFLPGSRVEALVVSRGNGGAGGRGNRNPPPPPCVFVTVGGAGDSRTDRVTRYPFRYSLFRYATESLKSGDSTT